MAETTSVKTNEEFMEVANSPIGVIDRAGRDDFALSPAHEQYLLQRHGTLDLDPVPQPDDADPLNWIQRKAGSIEFPVYLVLIY